MGLASSMSPPNIIFFSANVFVARQLHHIKVSVRTQLSILFYNTSGILFCSVNYMDIRVLGILSIRREDNICSIPRSPVTALYFKSYRTL